MVPLANVLLRQVPAELLAGVHTGEYRVIGSIIQSVSSGRIVGHLQETSALTSLMSAGPLDLPQLALGAVSVVQNEQIKAAVALVQSLQVANLALSGISIGVSVAGTALLAQRISRIEDRLGAMLPALAGIARQLEAMRIDRIQEDFTRLRTLAHQVDEAWLPSASTAEWIAIARDAHFLADGFERRAQELEGTDEPLAAEPLIDAFNLAAGLRITARLGARQDDMAQQAAQARTTTLVRLGQRLQPGSLALARVSKDLAGTSLWEESLANEVSGLKETLSKVRDRELAAAATTETLDHLASQGISGREWLEMSMTEDKAPLLLLPC